MIYKPDRAASQRLADYRELVREWAPRLDLISDGDLERFDERHVADSLRLADLVDAAPEGVAVDVGSGAGLPGIPLAIASDRHWRLIEPRRKRAAFLEEVVRSLGLESVEVVAMTAERAAGDARYASAHAIAVTRAVTPPDRVFDLLVPLVAPGGIAAAVVGPHDRPANSTMWRPGVATVRVPMDRTGKK